MTVYRPQGWRAPARRLAVALLIPIPTVTASLSVTLADATLSGSATYTAPPATGSGLTVTLADATLSATATYTAPPATGGSLTVTAADASLSGSATHTAAGATTGTLAVTLADATASGTATYVAPPSTTASLGGSAEITEDFSGTLANWTEHTLYTSGSLVITADGWVRTGSTNTTMYYHNTTPSSADQDLRGTLRLVGSVVSGEVTYLAARMDTSADTLYAAGYRQASGWTIRKYVTGTITTVGTAVPVTLTDGQDYSIRFTVIGSTLTLYVDGVETVTGTDSSITAAGRVGIRSLRGTTPSDSASIQLDDFQLVSGSAFTLDNATLASSATITTAGITATLAATLADAVLAGSATFEAAPGVTAGLGVTLPHATGSGVVTIGPPQTGPVGPTQIASAITQTGPDRSTMVQVGADHSVLRGFGAKASNDLGAA